MIVKRSRIVDRLCRWWKPDGRTTVTFTVATLFLVLLSTSRAQQSEPVKPRLNLYITSAFDTAFGTTLSVAQAGRSSYERYFRYNQAAMFDSMVRQIMVKVIRSRAEELNLALAVTADPALFSEFKSRENCFRIHTRFWLDEWVSLHILSTISHPETDDIVCSTPCRRLKQSDALLNTAQWNELKADQPETPELRRSILSEIATNLVSRTADEITQWVVESSVRLRVVVLDFEQTAHDPQWVYLTRNIRAMVETELANSEAIMVFDEPDVDVELLNYRISGSYSHIDDGLRIDLKCVKLPSHRILAKSKAIIDSVDITRVSHKITEAANRLKSAMLTDFHRSCKTLAVVAEPPISRFSSGRRSREMEEISKQIVRNMTAKLRQLMAGEGQSRRQQDLKIYDNSEMIDSYVESYTPPADIISDLDVDYLVSVQVEDFGHRIRLSSDIHSYELDRPALAEYIDEQEAPKALVETAIERTVLSLAGKLCRERILPACELCSLITGNERLLLRRMGKTRMNDLRKKRGGGIRMGATAHDNPDIFLGKESSVYVEAFISHLLPQLRWFPAAMSHELEFTFGYDVGRGNLLRHGATGGNGFLNYKLVFNGWRYSDFPVVVFGGAGIGCTGIKYEYDPQESPHTGLQKYDKATIHLAWNGSVGLELPLRDRFRLQSMLRRISQKSQITFEDFWNDESITQPTGKLSSWYFMFGIKYIWR